MRKPTIVVDKGFYWDNDYIDYEIRKVFDSYGEALVYIQSTILKKNEEYSLSKMYYDETDETKFTTSLIERFSQKDLYHEKV